MKELLEKMQKRLEQLKIGHETLKADIFTQEGAIAECEKWISEIVQREEYPA